ncbi:MAG: transglutaminaseTgpA domain-containing protein [Caldilineaceae bacterium]
MISTEHLSNQTITEEQPHWALRLLRWLVDTWRPYLGWIVFLICLVLAYLPSLALGENRVSELQRLQAGVDSIGPMAVIFLWAMLGWRQPRRSGRWPLLRNFLALFLFLAVGVVVISQAIIGWLPGIGELWQAIRTSNWLALGLQIVSDWVQLSARVLIWWQGVRSGGAAQDNLIFAALAGILFWLFGGVTAWLVRRLRRGLAATLPLLWLLGTMLLYGGLERTLMLSALTFVIALHLLLDQQALVTRWQRLRLDYSGDLFIDRLLIVVGVGVVLFILAAIMPNLYINPVVARYYTVMAPWESYLEDTRGRLFPELAGVSRRLRGGSAGMPNSFLLGSGSDLGEEVVMQVRTDDTVGYDYEGIPGEMPPPPGHYMRGATLTIYNGKGWRNPTTLTRERQDANQPWMAESTEGRKQLVQTVTMLGNSTVLYAAPEPLEPGLDYQAEVRADGDLVALWQRASNYTVISSIPAVSEAMLAAAPAWGPDHPLPEAYAVHLQLPSTITDRTRELAAQLVADQTTMYGKARTIELFLRQYEYDLTVAAPPSGVTDVADYFLFDLQRGYCDYYATAFVVLARLAGLPTRFATGYAPGYWNEYEQLWTVTESQAHSWPEVYFPLYGWIPFEPTAARPELVRIGLPSTTVVTGVASQSLPPAMPEASTGLTWNWQMLFWLLPLALVVWGVTITVQRWWQRREDPWLGLLRWGRRLGRPLAEGETVLEYGQGLAEHVAALQDHAPDAGRVASREILALCGLVNALRYAPTPARTQTLDQITEHWARLRSYLPQLQKRRVAAG